MQGEIKVTINVNTKEEGEKVANLLQNIADKVNLKDLCSLADKVKENSNFFTKVVKILEKPIVQNFFK